MSASAPLQSAQGSFCDSDRQGCDLAVTNGRFLRNSSRRPIASSSNRHITASSNRPVTDSRSSTTSQQMWCIVHTTTFACHCQRRISRNDLPTAAMLKLFSPASDGSLNVTPSAATCLTAWTLSTAQQVLHSSTKRNRSDPQGIIISPISGCSQTTACTTSIISQRHMHVQPCMLSGQAEGVLKGYIT